MKRLIVLFLALCVFVSLAACEKKTYDVAADAAPEELSAAVDAKISNKELSLLPEAYIAGSMSIDVSELEGYAVKMCTIGTNIDEYGIFKCTDAGEAEEIHKMVESYLDMREKSWMPEYLPEEYPKIENADSIRLGSYVMYAILSEQDKYEAFEAFELELKEK